MHARRMTGGTSAAPAGRASAVGGIHTDYLEPLMPQDPGAVCGPVRPTLKFAAPGRHNLVKPVATGGTEDCTEIPNNQTLLMNPGDTIRLRMFDAPAPGGGDAFEVVMYDLTTHQSGFRQASAANGFQNTSIANCSGTPLPVRAWHLSRAGVKRVLKAGAQPPGPAAEHPLAGAQTAWGNVNRRCGS
jgi:hypothetical protein